MAAQENTFQQVEKKVTEFTGWPSHFTIPSVETLPGTSDINLRGLLTLDQHTRDHGNSLPGPCLPVRKAVSLPHRFRDVIPYKVCL